MIQPLPFKLPESLPEAIGYKGGRRWVALYWEPCGDEAMYNDACCSTDCNFHAFIKFTHHWKIRPWLKGYNLGNSNEEAEHWLLCDLKERDALIGPRDEVSAFLFDEFRKECPVTQPAEPLVISPEALRQFAENLREVAQSSLPTLETIDQVMREQDMATTKMIKELDNA